MKRSRGGWTQALLALALFAAASPAAARQAPPAGLMGDLLKDVTEVEEKLVSLAQAIPADKFDWRPGEGVRSIGEVVMHVAADNYFIPTIGGAAAPTETGIKSGQYPSAVAFEQRKANKEQGIAELQRSFAFLKQVMAAVPDSRLSETAGGGMTHRAVWILAATHLHEHLGQFIAYARVNGVVPPWSR